MEANIDQINDELNGEKMDEFDGISFVMLNRPKEQEAKLLISDSSDYNTYEYSFPLKI